ncbi:hypothetical protein PEX1_050530 [Penicillium expansum]|uniref:Uncharacterized protein n=1 Tax=Penicillium expansum TaxID=27334 RepID=A0A0A2JXT2_PENEN|nr:hypothetical protein PEX2_034550 [Penicillium expansum]KAJ5498227.1 hypothetical protein N7453_007278 [Penicillium expansum]KGO45022.1 hypothetical protein PEXP_090520 [Penicillium expansum]KGO60277.1 hypothetical protein PEX2_034550 [Penicillium expansum]KGO66120.1 hypothetical protein PEX1_050530 [Penicillium expansum]
MSDDNTRRHWHGIPGDRHEHLNVWMNGGAKSPSGRAAWAMPETDRRDSNTSTSSTGNKQTEGTAPNLPSLGERRRSSGGSANGLFSHLQSQKRESTDANMATRRASWNEQAAKGGMFSKWWEGYTRGSGSK